ncbi:MAG: hypothetical protein J7L17_02065 [Thaumarchaeota archaeon]|nr:hypothetical protein [Nitrososphaerota archaeon]
MRSRDERLAPAIREELKRIISSILGESGVEVLDFHLRKCMGVGLLEALIEDPRRLYACLRRIYGDGADAVIMLLGEALIKTYGLDISSRRFLLLIKGGSREAGEKLREIWASLVKSSLRSRGELHEYEE